VKLLAIETSTSEGSVAVLAGRRLLFHRSFAAARAHSTELFVAIKSAFQKAGVLDRIVVGLGPGSYAGVRIAIAASSGLQFACAAELVGIPSVAAFEAKEPDYCAIGDARRETYYFTRVSDGVCVEGPLLETEKGVASRLAALGHERIFSSDTLPHFRNVSHAIPSARRLAALGADEHAITQRGMLEPIYLRPPHITTPRARECS